MPASTASWSMAASSSSVSGGPSSASRLVSSCSTDDAPMTAEVTRSSRSAHCSASWASFWPRSRGDLVEPAHVPRASPRRGGPRRSCCRSRAARESLGDAVEVAVGEQPLRERGEHDAAHALLLELVEQALLDPAVEHRVRRLVDQQRRAELAGDRRCLLVRLRRGVRRDAGVQRATGADRGVERRHRLLDRASRRRSGGCRRCRRSPGPSGPATGRARPARTSATRRPARRARATCRSPALVEITSSSRRPAKSVAQVPAEVLLGPAVGRPVVVGQVEVRHAAVERPAQDRPLGLLGPVGAEVLPQPQRERRQLEPAAAAVAVVHGVVAVVGRLVVAHAPHRTTAGRSLADLAGGLRDATPQVGPAPRRAPPACRRTTRSPDADHAQQQVLGADVVVLQRDRLAQRELERLLRRRARSAAASA